jgi:hypothetical protein
VEEIKKRRRKGKARNGRDLLSIRRGFSVNALDEEEESNGIYERKERNILNQTMTRFPIENHKRRNRENIEEKVGPRNKESTQLQKCQDNQGFYEGIKKKQEK